MSDALPMESPTAREPLDRGVRTPRWLPLLVVVLAWVAQGPVLRAGWVWDDAIVVRDGAAVNAGIRAIPRMLTEPWGGEDRDVGLFRPLVPATLALEASVHGTSSAGGFHLVNLFLHGLAAVLLLRVLSRAMPDRPLVAGVAAALFAAHPLHTGTVSWIVARGDLLVVVLGAAGALLWVRRKTLDAASAALAGLCFFGALLSKEAALPLPFAWLVLDLAVRREGLRTTIARRWGAYLGLLLPTAGWFVLRQSAFGSTHALADNAVLAHRNVLERLYIGSGALVRTAARLFVPAAPTAQGSYDAVLQPRAPVPVAYAIAAGVVLLLTLAALVRWATRKAGPLDAAWGVFVALSIPVLQIVPIGAVFEDRFAYVPSAALLVVFGLAAAAVARRLPRAACTAVAVVVLGLSCAASWSVAADWHDDAAFYRSLLREQPDHVGAMAGLARTLLYSARDARREVQTTRVGPDTKARRDAAMDTWARDEKEAVALLERARTLPAGRTAEVLQLLGDAYLRLPEAQFMAADAAYQGALERKQVSFDGKRVPQASVRRADVLHVAKRDRKQMGEIYANRGAARRGQGENEKAIGSYDASLLWDPDVFEVRQTLGALYLQLKRFSDALPHLEAAVALAPPDRVDQAQRDLAETVKAIRERSQALYEEAATAEGRGEFERALGKYQDAIEVRKNFAAAWARAGRLLATTRGNFRDARTYVHRAMQILDEEKGSEKDEPADGAAPGTPK